MNKKIYLIILLFYGLTTYSQKHFTKFQSIKYKTVKTIYGTDIDDLVRISVTNFDNIQEFKNIKIELKEIKDTDSSTISIYNAGKLLQQIILPYPIWHLAQTFYLADINNDQKTDIKFYIYGTGSGLAGLLSTKVYLINMGKTFQMMAFFDFASENEYDLDGNGTYEILSCNHTYKSGHSYWVYNAYNFSNNKLLNVSKRFGYPLWTKHLIKTNRVVAREISYIERVKEYRELPDSLIIK